MDHLINDLEDLEANVRNRTYDFENRFGFGMSNEAVNSPELAALDEANHALRSFRKLNRV
jgi:hypothetical protein